MSEQEEKFTEVGLKQAIKEGNIETIERFVTLSGEDILSQLGVNGQYDNLIFTAVDSGDLKMVKTLLKRSNLIQAPMESIIDSLPENASEDMRNELNNFIRSENRSNLQTYKRKWNEWESELKEAKENGYDDLAEKLEKRMQFENDRRLENEGKRPVGTSENRWFLNENSWNLDGFGGLEYPMYGQDNAGEIIKELSSIGIQVDYSAHINEKTDTLNDYRIRVDEKDKEKLKEFLEQKRQKMQEKEDLEAFVSGHEEENSSNDPHEEVSFIEPSPVINEEQAESEEVKEEVKTRVENKVPLWMSTGMFPNFEQKKESTKTPDVSADTKDAQAEQNQGEKDMSTNKKDYYYTDPELETADYLAEHTSPDVKTENVEKKAESELKATDDMIFADPDLESVENEVKTTSPDVKTAEEVKPVENNAKQPEGAVENPQAEVVAPNPEQPKTDNLQTAVRKTFRDLNNLDAHMPVGQVLARLEDVEFKENETQKKELFDEIKRQYQLKRENPDYKVQGLNGRINSTDMLKFAQHIDNVIDDGEPDNIDYTQGHTEKIRSLATLDRHLQISEVLARLEDVAAKTQDPNEQALLDLVREGYEEKRKSPENDLSGLNSFVDSTAALNLAKRIDLAIDDGEIENVDCLIMDTVQVNDSEKAEEKNIVQDNVKESTSKTSQKENLPPNKFQRINIDPNDLPTPGKTPVSTESTVEKEPVSSEKSKSEEPFTVAGPEATGSEAETDERISATVGAEETSEEEKPFTVDGPEVTGSEAETDEKISATVGAAETEKESEGMKNGPGFWANWHKYPNYKFMSTDEGKSFRARPYYFNPSKLTEEEKELARHMLAKAGVKIDEVEAPLDFKKGPVPMQEGDDVWRVTGSKNIKKLKKFLNECQENEDKALGKDLTPAKSEDEKSVDWKGGAKKVIDGTGKFIKGVGSGIKKIGKLDSVKSINAAMDKFNESVFKTGLDSPEEFGSNMLIAIMAFPFDFLDIYLKTKAEKYADSGDSSDSDKKVPSMEDDRKKQHEALKKIMNKMVEKDPELFRELAEKGVLGDGRDGISQQERAENAKQFFMQPENEELMNRLKGAFAEVAKEKPGWIHAIYPSDYKGPVTPEVLLNHVMGWGNSPEAGADRTVVPPTADRTVVPPTGPALSPEMQAIMQQMQLLRAEIQGLREEVAQLRQENAQLKEQMKQQQAENAQLKAENAQLKAELEAYRSGKVKPGMEVSPSDGMVPPVATNNGATSQQTNPESTPTKPQTEKREIPDLDAVVRTPFMNNLGRSEVNAILEDELSGYKEAKDTKEFEPGSREEFLNKVAKVYSGKEEGKLNNLIISDKELTWANEIARVVENGGENGNGDNFPKTTKEIIVQESQKKEDHQPAPTPGPAHQPAEEPEKVPGKNGNKKDKSGKKKRNSKQEIAIVINVINSNKAESLAVNQENVANVVKNAMSDISEEKQPKIQARLQELNKGVESYSKDENKLTEAQAQLRKEHPEIFEEFTLNDQNKPVNKEGEIVKADEIRKKLGLKENNGELYKAATQKGMIAILKAGSEAGHEGTEQGKGIHAEAYKDDLKKDEKKFFEDHPALARYGLNAKRDGYINRHDSKPVTYDDIKKAALGNGNEWAIGSFSKPSQKYSDEEKLFGLFKKLEKAHEFASEYRQKLSPGGKDTTDQAQKTAKSMPEKSTSR